MMGGEMGKVDDSLMRLAAAYLRKHARRLSRYLKGVGSDDRVRCVHQARVAGRRLRAGLRFFGDCFGAERAKGWTRAIRRVARALGPARDLDVQIKLLEAELAEPARSAAARADVEQLLDRRRRQRRIIQKKVERAARAVLNDGEPAEMARVAQQRLKHLAGRDVPATSAALEGVARRRVLECWKRVQRWEGSLASAADLDGHHRMRIAVKRLRYTLEIRRPAHGEPLAEVIEQVRMLQELLGEIHDCDVWVALLDRLMAAADGRRGLAILRGKLAGRRKRAFARLLALWRRQRRADLWRRMLAAVGAGGRKRTPRADQGETRPLRARIRRP
jgi:CHAD domain-containing protein